MPNTPSFTVYNASAGSGKTYSLVKEYLKIMLASEKNEPFKHILAITFTNKAVAEMKQRIVETLKQFSNPDILDHPNTMFETIGQELQIEAVLLHEKSQKLLQAIIHNYAAFDVSTIDGFTHKIIRTFAHDLKLPLNFEVELDQEALLNEAVDSLIAKAGTDQELTEVLVDFAIEKADDDKSWDVSYDFNKIAKLLVNENDLEYITSLKDKTIADFNALKTQLKTLIKETENTIVEVAKGVLSLIKECGLEFNDFSRGTLPNHFKRASELNLDKLYENKLEQYINERSGIYTKTLPENLAAIIDSILPEIETSFKAIKRAVYHLKFLRAFYKNITPLSVLNALNKELNALKDEQNKMLISEFNTIINSEIKNQPTPFIYERIGEKFNHYFIDEFQDTSVLQWTNLIPLIDNSLSSIQGSALLVGDAKQAIYRWRGGKAEQFIGLSNNENPFPHVKKELINLPTNYRSFREIVNFNNGLFNYLSSKAFSKQTYEFLYQSSHQKPSIDQEGLVQLSFLDFDKEDDRDAVYCQKVQETVQQVLEQGFQLGDICVLVRKKKEGVAIAKYLSQQEIPIISSETLLLNNAPQVAFLQDVLTLLVQPKNNEAKVRVLDYLTSSLQIDDKHAFFNEHIHLSVPVLFKSLQAYNLYLDTRSLLQLSLYELTETLIRHFNLVKTSNAYVQFYLDIVLDYTQKKGSDIAGFLHYFETKKESLSIVSPTEQNAVQIMTVHKSKGLEFPVVIFPYADLDIYKEIEPQEWLPLDPKTFGGFPYALLNYSKDFQHYGEKATSIYVNHESEKELDNINLLYVTLTRAIEQLHIISKNDPNPKRFSGLFIEYLKHLGLWKPSQLSYFFGTPEKPLKPSKNTLTLEELEFISSRKEDHLIKIVTNSGFLWDTQQEQAIEKGNLIHDILSNIKALEDVEFVFNDYTSSSVINQEQALILKKTVLEIIGHPKLKPYFSLENTIYNERDIITKQGPVLRPDRVVVNSQNEATIIDYKTGQPDKGHEQQLITYQDTLQSMHFKVVKKFLVYIDDAIHVKEV